MSRIKTVGNFLVIYLSLIFFDIQLKHRGFQNIFPQYVSKYKIIRQINTEINNEKVFRFLKLINSACLYYPSKAQCLHRSFLAFRFLRQKFAIPVELVIGVKKFPFSAHAWLELNGEVVLDSIEVKSYFMTILRSGE